MFGGQGSRPVEDFDDDHVSDLWQLRQEAAGDMAWQRHLPMTEDAAWPSKRAGAMTWQVGTDTAGYPRSPSAADLTASFMFGGERTGVPGMSDLWSYDGTEWTSHCPQTRQEKDNFLHWINIPTDSRNPDSPTLPAHICTDSSAWQASIPQTFDTNYDFNKLPPEQIAFEMWAVDQVPTSRWPLPRSFGTITAIPDMTGEGGSHAILFGGSSGAVNSNGQPIGDPQPLNDLWHFRYHKNSQQSSGIGAHTFGKIGNPVGMTVKVEVEWTYVGPTFNYVGDDGVGNVGEYVTDHGYGSTAVEALWPGARSGHAAYAGADGRVFIFGGVGQHLGRRCLQPGGADPQTHNSFQDEWIRKHETLYDRHTCSLLSDLWAFVPVAENARAPNGDRHWPEDWREKLSSEGCDRDLAPSCQPISLYPGVTTRPAGIGDPDAQAMLKRANRPNFASPWSGMAPWDPQNPNPQLEDIDPENSRIIVPAYAQNQPSGFQHSRWAIIGGHLPGTAGPTDGRLGSWVSTPLWMTPRHSMASWSDGQTAFVLGGQSTTVERQIHIRLAEAAGCDADSTAGCFVPYEAYAVRGHSLVDVYSEVSCQAGGLPRNGSTTALALNDMWSFSLGGGADEWTTNELGIVAPQMTGLPADGSPWAHRAHAAFWQPTDRTPAAFWSGAGMREAAAPAGDSADGAAPDSRDELDGTTLTGWSWDSGGVLPVDETAMNPVTNGATDAVTFMTAFAPNAGGWRWDPLCLCGTGVQASAQSCAVNGCMPTYDAISPFACPDTLQRHGTSCGLCEQACLACHEADYNGCTGADFPNAHERGTACEDASGKPGPCAGDPGTCATHECDVCRACTCPKGDDECQRIYSLPAGAWYTSPLAHSLTPTNIGGPTTPGGGGRRQLGDDLGITLPDLPRPEQAKPVKSDRRAPVPVLSGLVDATDRIWASVEHPGNGTRIPSPRWVFLDGAVWTLDSVRRPLPAAIT